MRSASKKSPDCIVVGGGVIGLSISRQLAGEGLSVTLLERGRCGGEASWAGAGVLAPCNPHRRDAIARLRDQSLELYPSFCAELAGETGIDPEYDPCGELEIALNADALRSLRENEQAGKSQFDASGRTAYEFHSSEKTVEIEPAVSSSILGSLECRRTAQVRNPRLIKALMASCEKRGVKIVENCLVHKVTSSGERVVGVSAECGEYPCDNVVISAGPWSGQIGRQGVSLPVHPVRGQMILMKFDRRPFQRVIARGKTYLVPRRDGHVLLGATEEHDGSYSKRNTAAGISGLIQTAVKLVPVVADATMIMQWTGLRPGTPDENPIIGPIPGLDGLIAATGHYRAGLILTPITAEIVSRLVQRRPLDFDISSCAPARTFSQK